MFNLTSLRDSSPVKGMNSVKDIQDLSDGECVELVNARPGNPPDIRKGCDIWLIASTSGYTLVPPWIVYQSSGGTLYIICWVQDGDNYHLVKINTDLRPPTLNIIGTATNFSFPYFDFIKLHDCIYANVDESMVWEGDEDLVGNKIIIPGDDLDDIREQSIRSIPPISSVEISGTGIWSAATDNYIAYAVTYVRHTEVLGFSGVKPIQVTSYNPGVNEGAENPDNRRTVHIIGSDVGIKINVITTSYERLTAQKEGATHIRIYKSTRQNSIGDALGATKYWAKDVPITSSIGTVIDITLDKNPVKIITIENHGCSDSETIRIHGVLGTTELNENDYTVASSDAGKTFRLSGTDPSNFSKYESGGHVLKNPINISGITIPDNTVTVQTSTEHIIDTGTRAPVVMDNLVGSTQLNNLIMWTRYVTDTRELIFENPGLTIDVYALGGDLYVLYPEHRVVNNIDTSGTYIVVKMLVAYRDRTYSGQWLNPVNRVVTFDDIVGATELNGKVCTVTAATKCRVGGWYGWDLTLDVLSSSVSAWGVSEFSQKIYISLNTFPIDIASVIFTINKVIIDTASPHGLSNGDNAYLYDITGTSELNGDYYEVSNSSSTQFSIPYEEAFGLSSYVSGGIVMRHAGVIDSVFLCYPLVHIDNHTFEDGDFVHFEEINGCDELNDNSFQVEVVDDNNFYVLGVDSNDITAYDYGGIAYIGGFIFDDDVSDTVLTADPAPILVAYGYTYAPNAKYVEFVNSRMWLFGIEGYPAMAFYSEAPGEDGGTPTDYALAYPQKYASWWKDSYAIHCDTVKGASETGIKRLIDDIYFFFEERVFALFGGDPTSGAPTEVGKDIGCPFPYTIIRADIPYLGGVCILFVSNKGPAVIKQGGEIILFTEFAHKELWPDHEDSEIYEDLFTNSTTKQHIQRNCNAMYWRDTWTIIYRNYAESHKILEFYFNPELTINSDAAQGSFKIELASV